MFPEAVLVFIGLGLIALAAEAGQPGSRASARPEPPMAKIKPKALRIHGDVRVDDYYWLRERQDPEVVSYLEAENAYLDAVMAHTKGFQESLFKEIVARIKRDDESVPYRKDDYWYYWRYPEDGEYRVYLRKKGALAAGEQVMLDGNTLADEHDFFFLSGVRVSPNHETVAYAVDSVGRRQFTAYFRDLESGENLPDKLTDVTDSGAWANDSKTYFYAKLEPDTLRWNRIFKHVLGTDPATDELVYEEADEEFRCFVSKTKSERYILIGSRQTQSSEYRYIGADDPDSKATVFLAREPNHEYSLDHFEDRFLVRTNWEARNFRIVETRIGSNAKDSWRDVISHREDVLVEGFEVFSDHLVVSERQGGLTQIQVRPWDGSEGHHLEFEEPAYFAYISDNPEMDTAVLRYGYTSLTTPDSIIDYDMVSRKRTVLKEEEVRGDFDRANYRTERLEAPTRDGFSAPISVTYRKDLFKRDGTNPLLLYGYGSYGASVDATFSSDRLSLLDRGFVYGIAHVRGGQELGREWYENGKLMRKKNTFLDFIACARYLAEMKYVDSNHLFAKGDSAGGLLMGAVINMAPELFKGVVSQMAFVDVLTTMLDPGIPLTTYEYDEWGDPNKKEAYDHILSYSPYDNIEAKNYPNLLLTTGLHDSQVQYWEPAKYVAKMRAMKTDDNLLLLKTDMEAGHVGATGRFERHRDTALIYTFLLDLAGKVD